MVFTFQIIFWIYERLSCIELRVTINQSTFSSFFLTKDDIPTLNAVLPTPPFILIIEITLPFLLITIPPHMNLDIYNYTIKSIL